mgnify:CR=1 FL=1
MFRPLLLTAIISITVTSSPVSANNDWVAAVLDHPSLRVQHSAIEKQQWKILELEAKKGFDFAHPVYSVSSVVKKILCRPGGHSWWGFTTENTEDLLNSPYE